MTDKVKPTMTASGRQPPVTPTTGAGTVPTSGAGVGGPKTPADAPLVAKNPYLARVKPDEPFFVLRGQDALAPQFVREWAEKAKSHGLPTEKYLHAMKVATDMEHYPHRKLPD